MDESADSIALGITLDTHGPRITSHTPQGTQSQPVGLLDVTFSEAIQPLSFTPADAVLDGPLGAIAANQVTDLGSDKFRVALPTRTADGTHHLNVGPDILDIAGNAMNQDADGTNGEAIEDRYDASFSLAGLAPVIDRIDPIPSPGGSTTAAIDQLTVHVSQDLAAAGVNSVANWQLVHTGPGGAFDDGNDVAYPLIAAGPYVSGTAIHFDLSPAPLQVGQYRLTALATGLADLDGDPLDGNADAVGGDDDVHIAWVEHTGIVAADGGSYAGSADATLPSGLSGEYWIFVRADATNVVFEFTLEDNNVGRSSERIDIAETPAADLAPGDVTAEELAVAGQPSTFSWRVTNLGPGQTGDGTPTGVVATWTDRIVLSRNAAYGDGADVFVANVVHSGSLAGGASAYYDGTWTGTLPDGLAGNYYVFVMADHGDDVYESLDAEANAAISGDQIEIASGPYADLEVTGPRGPPTAVVGQSITVEWTVSNSSDAWGATPTYWWHDRIVLSKDGVPGNGDEITLADVYHNGALGIEGSYDGAVTVTVPAGTVGQWNMFVVADVWDRVYEFRYDDNNTSGPLAIDITGADLVVDSVMTVPTGSGVFGEAIDVTWLARNAGSETAGSTWNDRIWLSTDAILSGNDTALWTGNPGVVALASGQTYQHTQSVTLPLSAAFADGDYYIIVQADSHSYQPETDETNNNLATSVIQLATPVLPDLEIEAITWPAGPFTDGQQIALTATIGNTGAGDATNDFYVRFRVDGNYIGRILVTGGGAAGGTATAELTWTASSGTHQVEATADEYNTVYESDETDNVGVDPLAGVIIELIDWETGDTPTHIYDSSGSRRVRMIVKDNTGTPSGATWADGDSNGDEVVGMQDFLLLVANFGQSIASSALIPAVAGLQGEYLAESDAALASTEDQPEVSIDPSTQLTGTVNVDVVTTEELSASLLESAAAASLDSSRSQETSTTVSPETTADPMALSVSAELLQSTGLPDTDIMATATAPGISTTTLNPDEVVGDVPADEQYEADLGTSQLEVLSMAELIPMPL